MSTTNPTGNDATFHIQEAASTATNTSLAQSFANMVDGQAVKTPANVIVDALGQDQVGQEATGVTPETGGRGIIGWLSSQLKVLRSIAAKQPTLVNGAAPANIASFTFIASTVNVTTAQLAAGATFTGQIETAFNQQGIQVMANSDTPYVVSIQEFQDQAGTKPLGATSFTRGTGQPLNETVQINGNFLRVTITNTGTVTSTSLFLDASFGPLPPLPKTLTNAGNLRVSVSENGVGLATDASIQALTSAVTVLQQQLEVQNLMWAQAFGLDQLVVASRLPAFTQNQ